MSDDRRMDEEINELLKNFSNFFGEISKSFAEKDSYEIYRDKAMMTDDTQEAIKFMKKSVSEANKMISPQLFEKSKGRLWEVNDARPYILVKKQLAELYTSVEMFDEAIKEYFNILELDINDNLMVKFDLISLLLKLRRDSEFEMLIERYNIDFAFVAYVKALYYFNKKESLNAKRYIKKAFDKNIHLPKYLIGIEQAKIVNDEVYILGGKDEAIFYFYYINGLWISIEGALNWLVDELFIYTDKNKISLEFTKEEAKQSIDRIIS